MSGPTRSRTIRVRGLLGTAAALALLAGMVLGCSTAPSGPGSSEPANGSAPGLIWEAGTAGGDPLAHFRDTPYNNDGTDPPTLETSPNIAGHVAIKFSVPGGGQRTELEPKLPTFTEGDDYYFGFAHYLPPDFPVDIESWQVIAQWKNSGQGSPPIEVKIGRGQYFLDGGAGGKDPSGRYYSRPIGPARAGTGTDIVVHIKFSSDSTKSVVDVWLNGQKRISGYQPPGGTRYPREDSYLKTGIYRDTAISQPAVLFLNDARVATSYPSAAALAGPTAAH